MKANKNQKNEDQTKKKQNEGQNKMFQGLARKPRPKIEK
jgi:hypothetical protein